MPWNKNNPALRRIHADVKELIKHPSRNYAAEPLEENMFEWHFVIRGPDGTDFEGGRYHGRIILPSEYPFKPPAIVFLTNNGRWRVKEKICLSISNYHPEQWQPAWGIRTILEAIISFMTSPGEGAIGAIEVPSAERRRLAKESLKYTHPLMPELPDEVEVDVDPEAEKELQRQVALLREGGNQKETESLPKPDVETESDINEESPSTNLDVADNSEGVDNSRRSDTPRDHVDSLLSQISVALLISIFALLYRKALHLYA